MQHKPGGWDKLKQKVFENRYANSSCKLIMIVADCVHELTIVQNK